MFLAPLLIILPGVWQLTRKFLLAYAPIRLIATMGYWPASAEFLNEIKHKRLRVIESFFTGNLKPIKSPVFLAVICFDQFIIL